MQPQKTIVFLGLFITLAISLLAQSTAPGFIKSEFIYETAPFPECHASTLAESKSTLVAAWYGGTKEKHPDVGIWVSRLSRADGLRRSKLPTASNRPPNAIRRGIQCCINPSPGRCYFFTKSAPTRNRGGEC